ncbi:response regulator [Thalassovita aquimarina]|uniref:response regulator n=1 Tax=Thalassovita aquimarina TaxID=2785917 RepID=UPI0035668226
MDDRDLFQSASFPNPVRPLLGLTLLAVEDSRYARDALRLMAQRSGARIRTADGLAAAGRHLDLYRPSVIIVDLGLPDGDGTQLIARLHRASPRFGIILGTSGDDTADGTAIKAGADGFLPKPVTSLANFQELILSHLPEPSRPMVPRIVNDDVIRPDMLSYREDLIRVADLLRNAPEGKGLDYLAQFLTGVARSAGDHALQLAGEALTIARMQRRACRAQLAQIAGLVQDRLNGTTGSEPRV